MTRTQKLELTWIGKENRSNLEPRILLETLCGLITRHIAFRPAIFSTIG